MMEFNPWNDQIIRMICKDENDINKCDLSKAPIIEITLDGRKYELTGKQYLEYKLE